MFTRHQQRSVLFKRLQPNQNKVQKEKILGLKPYRRQQTKPAPSLGWERARAQKAALMLEPTETSWQNEMKRDKKTLPLTLSSERL